MKPIYILLLTLLPFFGHCKNKYSREQDHFTISIIPEIGGSAYFAQLASNENKFYSGYNLGCNLEVKPFKNFGLTSGYSYNKFYNSIHYNEAPVLLNFYTKNELVFSAGAVIYFNPDAKQYGNPDPSVGMALGIRKSGFGLMAYLSQNHPLLNLDENIKFAIALGLRIDLFRIQLIKQ